MAAGLSSFVIKWINFLTMIFSLGLLALGIYLSTRHQDCAKFLMQPVLVLGVFTFVLSLIGFIGAWRDISFLLWIYLTVMFILLVFLGAFTVFAFMVTNTGAGHVVSGQGFKEYKLGDYNRWLIKRLNDTDHWKNLKSCLVDAKYCKDLATTYPTVELYQQGLLNSIQSGCCRPPTECGYPIVNATYFDLSQKSNSTQPDCSVYSNDPTVECFDCGSCKAGVAQYLKQRWRFIAIFNIIVFVVLGLLYSIGCCARRNAAYAYSKV